MGTQTKVKIIKDYAEALGWKGYDLREYDNLNNICLCAIGDGKLPKHHYWYIDEIDDHDKSMSFAEVITYLDDYGYIHDKIKKYTLKEMKYIAEIYATVKFADFNTDFDEWFLNLNSEWRKRI